MLSRWATAATVLALSVVLASGAALVAPPAPAQAMTPTTTTIEGKPTPTTSTIELTATVTPDGVGGRVRFVFPDRPKLDRTEVVRTGGESIYEEYADPGRYRVYAEFLGTDELDPSRTRP